MRQKLGIAIALVKDAPNVLLDEPTSGLDPQSGREFLEILVQMRDQGKSVFMSTHDIFRAKLIADRIGFMRKGQLVMLKTAKELANEDLTELYIQYMEEQPGPTAPAAV
jgi:ABC-2 type transport system ATP-binding protein